MSDLETALKEQIAEWRDEEPDDEFKAGIWRMDNSGLLRAADELETLLDEHREATNAAQSADRKLDNMGGNR